MKVNCLKEIVDNNRICCAIDKFKQEHYGDKPSYIVMNFETKAALKVYYVSFVNNKEDLSTFHGIPIAVSDNLKYGEVDIV